MFDWFHKKFGRTRKYVPRPIQISFKNGSAIQCDVDMKTVPVLNEVVVNRETGQFKLGDGVTPIAMLEYRGNLPVTVTIIV